MSFAPIFGGFGSGGSGGGGGGGGGALSFFAGDFATRPWASTTIWPGGLYDAAADKTYFGWISQAQPSVVRVAYYDHVAGSFSDPVTIGTSQLVDDDHGAVALCLLSDNRLAAFWGAHDSTIQWAISGTSGGEADITDWTEQTDISGSNTYPKPINIPDGSGGGTIWLIHQTQSGSNSPLSLRKATYTSGGAVSFGAASTIVDFDGGSGARVYAAEVRRDTSDNIEFMATRATADDSSRSHVYYFKIITSSDAIENIDGTTSTASGSLPIDLTNATNNYREFETASGDDTGTISWCRDANDDLHCIFGDDNTSAGSAHDVKHMIYSSGSWSTPAVAFTAIRKGSSGFVENWCLVPLDSGDQVEAWYPEGNTGSWSNRGGDSMARKVHASGSWGSEETIHTGTNSRALGHPIAVLDGHADFRVLFTEVTQGVTDGDRAICERYAYGDSAFLQWPSLNNSFWPHVVEQIKYEGTDGTTPTDLDESVARQPLTWQGDAEIQSNKLSLDGANDAVAVGSSGASARRYNMEAFYILLPKVRFDSLTAAQVIWGVMGGAGDRGIFVEFGGHNSPKTLRVAMSTDGTNVTSVSGSWSPADTATEYDIVVTRDDADNVRIHAGETGGALSLVASGSFSGAIAASGAGNPARHGAYDGGSGLVSDMNGDFAGARIIATDMGVTDSDHTPEAIASWTTN